MRRRSLLVGALVLVATASAGTPASDDRGPAMFGGDPSRNMASDASGLPSSWNVETGENVRWHAELGSQSYGGPVVHGNRIYVGTNNQVPRDPEITGDRGVLMVFDTSAGEFLWQAVHDKHPAGRVHDWPRQGLCSAAYVEGDRLYYVSNRGELVAADTEGFRDGENDGPFQAEGSSGPADADFVWKLDMIEELGVFPHNMSAGSPLVIGDLLFTVTGNGVDEGHLNIPAPEAPSFLAVDRRDGTVVWQSAAPGDRILHGSWSNPAYDVVDGEPQVVFPGGDGWLYSFRPSTGELMWKFDLNPKDSRWRLGGAGTRNNVIATPVFWEGKVFVGMGQDPEHGQGPGRLWAIDASLEGDVTDRAAIWHRGGEEFNRTLSTVAIHDGLLYVADLSGLLYCLDAATGELQWKHDTFAAVWGSPFVADGKVYLGNEEGNVTVLEAGPTQEVIAVINMGAPVYTTPVARDGVLYIAAQNRLYALGADPGREAAEPAAEDEE